MVSLHESNYVNMNFSRFLVPCLIASLISCQGSSTGSSTSNDNTAIKVPTDTVKVDTVKAAPAAPSYAAEISDPKTVELVRATLQSKFKAGLDKNLIDSLSRKFMFFSYDLNDDGKKEILVGLTGPYFCGSGGCSPMILDEQGKVVTSFSVSDYPIVVDNNKTKGWKDLFIRSGAKFHVVKFDGRKYPSNPSVQPVSKFIPGDGLPRLLDNVNETYPWFTF